MKSMIKHAYLIIAHDNPYVLEKLILMLDDERNDIYIHVDKKVNCIDFTYFKKMALKSKLTFIDRIAVYWGHVSQIEVELKLFRAAFDQGSYSYYHLISGSDLPIKSQDDIHDFFQRNEGVEFVGFSDDILDEDKVRKIHLFPKCQRVDEKALLKRLARKVSKLFLAIQQKSNYSIKRTTDQRFVHGANWVSITHQLVLELLKRENDFLNFYRYSSCTDEIYKQTFILNSEFKDKIFNINNELVSCQRFMDWKRGRPYTFRDEDYELIVSSNLLFARKFEDRVDKKIVDKIYSKFIQ